MVHSNFWAVAQGNEWGPAKEREREREANEMRRGAQKYCAQSTMNLYYQLMIPLWYLSRISVKLGSFNYSNENPYSCHCDAGGGGGWWWWWVWGLIVMWSFISVPTGSRSGMWQSFKGLMLLRFGAGRWLLNLVCMSGKHTGQRRWKLRGVMRFEFYSIQVDKWDLLFVPLFG